MAATETVGLVVSGGGARGAYEAGALSVLLPALARQNRYPSVFVGTSAGAFNVMLFASLSHLNPEQAAEQALQWWRDLRLEKVVRPVGLSTVVDVARYLGQLARLPGARLPSLVDTGPLRRTLEGWKHWSDLHRNVDQKTVACVAVVATSATTGRSVVFVEQSPRRRLPERDDDRGIDYVRSSLDGTHVLASSAIPVGLPAVQITDAEGSQWYADGGPRLHAPIKPAIALDVDRVAIVAPDALHSAPAASNPAPDVYDGAAQLLRAAMVDHTIEDVRTLDKVNRLVRGLPESLQVASRKRPYKEIPYCYVGPSEAGRIGATADEVLAHPRQGRSEPLNLGLLVLSNALGGGRSHGELLSFLLFDPVFIDRLIEMGQRDARQVLATSDPESLWR